MNRYSLYGSNEFELKMQYILDLISTKFQAKIDCSNIQALILGGGYGKGEGGVLQTAEGEAPYNDLDFFVISKKINPWTKRKISNQLSELHHELHGVFGIDIDFSDIKPINALPAEPFTLMWYDLKQRHNVIFGKKDILKYLPDWNIEQIPIMESLKLLLNRAMGLFLAKSFIAQGKSDVEYDFINRNIHKAYQALGEAILIVERTYHWSNPVRIDRIKEMSLDLYTNNPVFKVRFMESMDFKLKPKIEPEAVTVISARYQEAINIYKEIYYKIWAKYLQVADLSHQDYLKYLGKFHLESSTLLYKIKNALLNLRDMSIKSFDFQMFFDYPRLRLFYVLPWMVFDESYYTKEVCRVLGIRFTNDTLLLEKRFLSLWQRYN